MTMFNSTSVETRGPADCVRRPRLIALGALAAWCARRAHAIRAVAPELRSAALWLPATTSGPLTLDLGRRVCHLAASRVADGIEVTQHRVDGGQDAFIYRPAQSTGAALLWIHAGGNVLGRPEIDHDLCSSIARGRQVIVVSTRYRLAPEHPFPAAHDDCFAALRWMNRSADLLGIEPDRITVGGASAGGGLAAGIVQRAVDEGVPVAAQILLYPMLDDRTTTRPRSRRGNFMWTRRSNAFGWAAYLGSDHAARDLPPYAAPGRRSDLDNLPPAWIGVGDLDLFHDEDVDYAQRLNAAGVQVELRVEPGTYHAADYLKPTAPSMLRFRRSMLDAIG